MWVSKKLSINFTFMECVRDGIRIRYELYVYNIFSESKNKKINFKPFKVHIWTTNTKNKQNRPLQTAQNPKTQPEPTPKRNL